MRVCGRPYFSIQTVLLGERERESVSVYFMCSLFALPIKVSLFSKLELNTGYIQNILLTDWKMQKKKQQINTKRKYFYCVLIVSFDIITNE